MILAKNRPYLVNHTHSFIAILHRRQDGCKLIIILKPLTPALDAKVSKNNLFLLRNENGGRREQCTRR